MSAEPTPEEIAAIVAALNVRTDEPEPTHAVWRRTRRAAVRRTDPSWGAIIER